MSQITYPPVLEAMQCLKEISADEETRRMAEARELALFTERIEIDAAEKRGEARGEERGISIGATQAMELAVQKLMANGMTEATARAMLGLA